MGRVRPVRPSMVATLGEPGWVRGCGWRRWRGAGGRGRGGWRGVRRLVGCGGAGGGARGGEVRWRMGERGGGGVGRVVVARGFGWAREGASRVICMGGGYRGQEGSPA